MNNQDISRVIASYLDNEALEKLYLSGAIPSLKNLVSDQHFWHARIETLLEKKIPFTPADWRETYQILKRELKKLYDRSSDAEYFTWNEEDNVTASRILSSLGYQPTVLDMTLAAENNSVNILKFLLEDGRVDPSEQVPYDSFESEERIMRHYSPLVAAAYEGHEEAVRLLLLDSRVDPGSYDNDDDYALSMACQASIGDSSGNYTRIVRMLLADQRVNPRWGDSDCLGAASKYADNFQIMKILLEDNRADPSEDENMALRIASKKGRISNVKLLLQDPRVNPGDYNGGALRGSSQKGHVEVVKLLLSDPRVDPSAGDNRAIIQASGSGHIEIVKLLLSDPRVDPSAVDNWAIKQADHEGHTEVVELLLADQRVTTLLKNRTIAF